MAHRSVINLALDDIMKDKRSSHSRLGRPLKNGKNNTRGVSNQSRTINKKNSLQSRLSWTGKDSHKSSPFANKRQENKKLPVHSRLAISANLTKFPVRRTSAFSGKQGLMTKNLQDAPVRLVNGTLMKGLRSDQILLQKQQRGSSHLQTKMEKIRTQNKNIPLANNGGPSWRKKEVQVPNYRTKLNFNRPLTVSIDNDIARARKLSMRSLRQRSPSSESEFSSDSSPVMAPPLPPRFKRNQLTDSVVSGLQKLTAERPPPPKLHRQILDPQLKKEIASLQGLSIDQGGRPGPGIKGFKMAPSRTSCSLSERFSNSKSD